MLTPLFEPIPHLHVQQTVTVDDDNASVAFHVGGGTAHGTISWTAILA